MPKMDEKENTSEIQEPKPDFQFKVVKEKPTRKYRKGSKYDPVLESFLSMKEDLVEVSIPDQSANYIRTQLNKRIESKKLEKKIKVSVVNDVCYLEKVK